MLIAVPIGKSALALSKILLANGSTAQRARVASESQTLAVQTYFVIGHARDIGIIGIRKSTNQLDYIVQVT